MRYMNLTISQMRLNQIKDFIKKHHRHLKRTTSALGAGALKRSFSSDVRRLEHMLSALDQARPALGRLQDED